MVGRRHRRRGDGRPPRRQLPVPDRQRRRHGRVPRGRATRAPRADVPEPPADARVRGPRRADEAHADDALRDDRAAGHDDAVRRRGGREVGLRAHRRGAGEDRGVTAAPRSRAQRQADTQALLRTEVDCWVASADETGNAHLVPLSFHWDGAALVLATPRSSPTATNLLRAGVARLGLGATRDVVLVDGGVTEGVDDATADAHTKHTGFDARTETGDYVYLRVTPIELRAWREANELPGRLLMRNGNWLESLDA